MDDMRTTAVWLSVMLTASTVALEQLGLFADDVDIRRLGRAEFRRHRERFGAQNFFQVRADFVTVGCREFTHRHSSNRKSSRTILRGPPSREVFQFLGGRTSMSKSSRPCPASRS